MGGSGEASGRPADSCAASQGHRRWLRRQRRKLARPMHPVPFRTTQPRPYAQPAAVQGLLGTRGGLMFHETHMRIPVSVRDNASTSRRRCVASPSRRTTQRREPQTRLAALSPAIRVTGSDRGKTVCHTRIRMPRNHRGSIRKRRIPDPASNPIRTCSSGTWRSVDVVAAMSERRGLVNPIQTAGGYDEPLSPRVRSVHIARALLIQAADRRQCGAWRERSAGRSRSIFDHCRSIERPYRAHPAVADADRTLRPRRHQTFRPTASMHLPYA